MITSRALLAALLLLGSLVTVDAIDLDDDGMSDVWERIYSIDTIAGDRDDDHDGFTNRQESALGTDPHNAKSAFPLVIEPGTDPGRFQVRIDTAFGKLYQVEKSTDLVNWSAFGSAFIGTGDAIKVPIPRPTGPIFYRGRLVGDVDSDGDGLTAWEEHQLGTSDSNPDSDADGMPDRWEFAYRLDPTINDSADDPDEDGLSNLQEYERGTNPNDSNSTISLQLAPGSISVILNPGQIWDEALTLTNTSIFASTFQLIPDGNLIDSLAYIDSDQASGPSFVWDDIKATGTILSDISDTDDGVESFDLPFPFPYFGQSFTTVFVSSNGFITFGEGSDQYDNYELPGANMPSNEIAGFHVDLSTAESGEIYYQNETDRVIIQFEDVARLDDNGNIDFQIILNRDGAIDLEYKNVPEVVDDATVGIQNGTRDKGLTVSYGQSYLHANMAVHITSASEWFTVSPREGTLGPTESHSVNVSFNAANLPSGIYSGQLKLSPDLSTPAINALAITMTVNEPPTTTILSPSDNTEWLENRALTISADAVDADGTITKVQFFADDQLIGESAAVPFTYVWPNPPAGNHVLTARALDDRNATAVSNAVHLVALTNRDGDTLPDVWELEHFGNLDQTGDGDADNDGLTNAQEYQNGTDPLDFYNGTQPVIVIVSGDNQHGPAGLPLPLAGVVQVSNQQGVPLTNAPVNFLVKTGDSAVAMDGGAAASSLQVRTATNGEASISLIAPETRGSKTTITADVGSGNQHAAVIFTERADAFLKVTPESLGFALNLPGRQSQNIVLENTGPTTLDFVCETAAASYSFADSNSPEGPVYQWEEIGTTGTLLSTVSQADDDYEAVDLPFEFPFFGNPYTRIYVSSNGFISVGAGSSDSSPGPLPGNTAVPGEIAAFHTDLNPSAGGRILYLNAPDHTVIQFDDVPHYDGSGRVTFQIILNQTGAITFQYKSMSGTLNAASVGLQNVVQNQGLEVAFNKPYVANGLAVRLDRDNSWLHTSPASGQIGAGQTVEIIVTADGSRLSDGNYDGLLRVRSIADQSVIELPTTLVANAPPSVVLVAPPPSIGVVQGENVTVEAQAEDRRGQVARVDFYEGSTFIGTRTEEPFAIVWQPSGAGTFILTARATDDQGAAATSAARILQIEGDSDGDGLGDYWEMANFGNLDQTALDDFDGDGRNNLQEFHDQTAGDDYYGGKLPYPALLDRTRGLGKRKNGLQPFIPTDPPRFFLKSDMVINLVGGNPESPVHGVIEVTADPDTGETQTTASGNAPPPYYGTMLWDPAPTATKRFDRLTVLFGAEDQGGAYDDPPNLMDDWEATAEETTILTDEYTTDQLIERTRAALKPIPPFDAPFSVEDDATFADFEFLPGSLDSVYITHSNYQFKWYPSPNLPERKSITWLEIFYPFDDPRTPDREDSTPIKTARHWEGTGTETDVYHLTPSRPGRYAIQILPGELMVDENRDGQMSITDGAIHNNDLTSQSRPYRFWINDDDDTELNSTFTGPAEAEQVPPLQRDCDLRQIVSKRNLEDFSRLWVNLTGVTDQVLSGDIQIGLKWKTIESDAPAINIYPSEDGEGSTQYLTNEAAAGRQIAGVFNNAVTNQSNKQSVDTNGLFIFKRDYWNGLSAQNPKKCLLFEGFHEGKGELAIILLDRDGHEITSGGSVWLELKNIKKMYERATATPDPLGPLPYTSTNAFFDEHEINYTPDVTPRFEQPAEEESQCLVFVHGWRMSYDDSVSFSETMFKRLWWQGYKGRFAAFRWATQTSFHSYNASEWLAWKYGKSLANYVENYLKHEMPDYTMNVAAHSMGNVVTSSALKRGMSLDTFFLMEAAIPSGCFNNAVNDYKLFLDAEVTNPTPDVVDDLGYRTYMEAVNVGKFVSFFNTVDYALATGITVIGFPPLEFQANWEKNQIDYKPNRFNDFDSTAGDYLYTGGQAIGQRVTLNWSRTLDGRYLTTRPVTDIHESMAFVARPRSKAAGAEPNNAAVFPSVVDLQAKAGFGRDAADHSGQFERPIQSLTPFYSQLFKELHP